jgi:tetratricopeptide (TPR) repeat protein
MSVFAFKSACCLIDCPGSRGTGFLITPDRVLTCYHVVAALSETQAAVVAFPSGRYEARLECGDPTRDWALLHLDEAVEGVSPLPLALAELTAQASWEAFGFPSATLESGLGLAGMVHDPAGQDLAGRPSLHLRSNQLSGHSQPQGFSGSPVVVSGQVVGMLQAIIPTERSTPQFEIVYACPAPALQQALVACGVVLPVAHTRPQVLHTRVEQTARHRQLPLSRNPRLVGRDRLLGAIHKLLISVESPVRWVILTGLGGVGKTQLALEYAYRHTDDSADYSDVLWVRAASQELLRSEFAALAALLELPESKRVEPEQRLSGVRRWFETNPGWLVVVDGADDPKAAAWLAEFLPSKSAGRVLITSTNPNWRARGHVLPIPVLQSRAAVTLLAARSGLEESEEAVLLIETLGRLPLAVVQAAAYLERTGITYKRYLELFAQRQRDLLSRPSLEDYPQTVATTWSLSFDRVGEESAHAAALLHLCSFLAPIPFPIERLTDGAAQALPASLAELIALTDNLALQDAVAIIRAYSLAEVADGHIWLHPLVQIMVRHRLESAYASWAALVIELLRWCIQPTHDEPRVWNRNDIYFPHALASLEHALESDVAHEAMTEVGRYLGAYIQTHVNGLLAMDLLLRIELRCLPVLGPAHPALRELRIHRARTLTSLGDWQSAVVLLEELFNNLKIGSEADGLVAAILLLERGQALMAGGRYQEALNVGMQALERLGSGLQKPLQDYLSSANSLVGVALVSLAHPAEGRTYLEQALTQFSEAEKPRSILWPIALHNFGQALEKLGEVAEAERAYRQAIAQMETLLGPYHPRTGQSRLLLGQLLSERGDFVTARKQIRKAFWAARQLPDSDNPQLAETLHALGESYLHPGYFQRARVCAEWALKISRALFKELHPYTVHALSLLARALHGIRDLPAARSYFEQTTVDTEQLYGAQHPEMASVLHNFGVFLIDVGETDRGEKLLERALSIDEAVYGKEHFEVATDLNTLSLHYLHKGEWEQALPLLERALLIRDKQLGPLVATTLDSVTMAARSLSAQGAWPLSLRYHELLVSSLERNAGADRTRLVSALNEQAIALLESGDLPSAVSRIERAFELGEQSADVPPELRVGILLQKARLATRQDQPEVAMAMLAAAERKIAEHPDLEWTESCAALHRDRGDLLAAADDFAGAVSAYQAALQILDIPAYADAILLANILIDLGTAEERLGQLDSAQQHLERSLGMTLRLRGEAHATTGTIFRRLGEVSRARGERRRAKGYFEQAYKVWERVFGAAHSQVGSILVDLGTEEVALGELVAAEAHLDAAQALARMLPEDPTRDAIWLYLPLALVRLRIGQKQLRRAQEVIDEALATAEFKALKPRLSLGMALIELANAYHVNGAPAAAIASFQRVAKFLEEVVNDEPRVRLTLARQYGRLGILYRDCHQHREAADAMAHAYGHLQKVPAAERDSELTAQLAQSHANYLRLSRRWAEAKLVLLDGLAALDKLVGPDGVHLLQKQPMLHVLLGEVLLYLHEDKEAAKYLDLALQEIEKSPSILAAPRISPDILAELHRNRAHCQLRLNQELAGAVIHLRTALQLETARYGEQHWRTALAAFELAKGLRQDRQIQEAKQYAKQARQISRHTGPPHLAKAAGEFYRQLRTIVVMPKHPKRRP